VTRSEPCTGTPSTLFLFDGDCGFCSTWVRVLERRLPRFPRAIPSQWADLDTLGLTAEDVAHNSWFSTRHLLPGGTPATGMLRPEDERP
jgi:hypothetical protein